MLGCCSLTQVGCAKNSLPYGPTFAPHSAETRVFLRHCTTRLQCFETGRPCWFIASEGVIALALSWAF